MQPGSQGEGTGMHMCEQWWLHCTSQWGRYILLSECVYCVAVTFKMTEWIEKQICMKFCLRLEHSSAETIWMIQKGSAMSNWWLAASSQQHICSCVMSCAEFFGKTSISPAPLQPRFDALWLLAFPKTKITFEREEISDCQWDSGKYNMAAGGDWVNCMRPQGPYFEGNWSFIVLCTMFLVSCIFFNKCLYFSYCIAGYLLDRPRTFTFDKHLFPPLLILFVFWIIFYDVSIP